LRRFEPRAADRALYVGDRDEPDGDAALVDDDCTADPRERRALEQLSDVDVLANDQLGIAIGDLIDE
jgi:hypothetical protein